MSNPVSDCIIRMLEFGQSMNTRAEIESAREILETVELAFQYYSLKDSTSHIPVFYLPKTVPSLEKILSNYITIRFGLFSNAYRKMIRREHLHPEEVAPAWERRYADAQREISFTDENGLETTEKVGTLLRDFNSIAFGLLDSEGGEDFFQDHSVNVLVCDSALTRPFLLAKYLRYLNFLSPKFSLQRSLCVFSNAGQDFSYLKESIWNAYQSGDISRENPVQGNVFVLFSNSERYRSFKKMGVFSTLSQKGYCVQNLFVFCISDKTYSLRKLFEEKTRFANIYQGQENSGEDFICYPVIEAAKKTTGLIISDNRDKIECGDDYDVFFPAVSQMIDGFDRRQRVLCNIISLCATEKSEELFYNYLQSLDPGFGIDEKIAIFDYIRTLWRERIIPKIELFAESSKRLAMVVEATTPDGIKAEIQSLFPNRELVFRRPSDLIPARGKNMIAEPKIVVMRFLHCKSYPSSYPNSFDPYVINPNQSLLEIIPEVLFKELIDDSEANRIRLMNKVLNSSYRRDVLGWEPETYARRTGTIRFDIFGDEESNEENEPTGPDRVVRVELIDGSVSNPIETEPVIYELQDEGLFTGVLRDLVGIPNVVGIQYFSELERILEKLLDERRNKGILADSHIREELKRQYPNNDFSKGEVWKLALKAKIGSLGFDKVVRDLSPLLEEKNVANRIKDWSNPNSKTMLPRKRKTRRVVFEYIGIYEHHTYLNSLYSRYLKAIHDARYYNGLIDDLIRMVVGHQITQNHYLTQKRLFPEVFELFDINSSDDLKTMQEIVRENTELKQIKSITTND